ncbi:MAG TPA: YceI family protein [Actinomycetota bacterium]|nr:YceI family protein [Actinomycetota bacterium]
MNLPRGKALAAAIGLVVVAGVGAVYLIFFTPEAPAPVALAETDERESQAGATPENLDPVGRWAVQNGSEAGYRVREKLARLPAPSDAVGRTDEVTGSFTVGGTQGNYTISDINIEVDMTTLRSDSDRRDNALRERGLETDRFPTATFTSPGPIELPPDVTPGRPVEFMLGGALTIHGVTRQVTIPVEAELDSRTIEVVGSLTIPMADFNIEPPNVANIVSVGDTGTLEFRLVLEKAV